MLSDDTCTATRSVHPDDVSMRLGLVVVYHRDPSFVGSSYIPTDGEVLHLGRGGTDFVPGVLDDRRVSRRHASLECKDDALTLIDHDSRNGTYVNGEPISRRQLRLGDVIGLGSVLVLVQYLRPGVFLFEHPRIAGLSGAMAEVLGLVERAARRDTTVLILGESGVGKELIAQELHNRSGRGGRFVAINCAGLTDSVLQSELFGHVRGAFSGADRARRGLVDQARGGTLFLDEIGDASGALQGALLRLLQEKVIRPVGSDRDVKVDVRILAATHQPLADAVQRGRFRRDLYTRLRRCVVRVPPLRERAEDVLPVAAHFIEDYADRPISISQGLALRLLRHDWPGNVRELSGMMERLVIEAGDADELTSPGWLDAELSAGRGMVDYPSPEPDAAGVESDDEPTVSTSRRARPESARELIDALAAHGGNVTTLAKAWAVGRNTLYRWMRDLDVDLDAVRDSSRG